MCETWRMTGVNWLLFVRTFFGWVGALVAGALISACLFSIGAWVAVRVCCLNTASVFVY